MNNYQTTNTRETIAHEQRTHQVARRRGALGLLATGAVITSFLAANTVHENNERHAQRLEAIKQIDTPVFKTIVLRGGTQLRLTPEEQTVSSNSGDSANLAGEIPKDEVWVAQSPLVDLENPEWIAVTKPGTENDINSMDERVDNTVWIHYGSLVPQGKGGGLEWKFNEDGSTSVNGELSPELGATFSVAAHSAALVETLKTDN